MFDAAEILGKNGVFAQRLEHYSVREAQVAMADEVAQTIAERSTLLAESGTGTGKTFAYLVPALLSGKKTLISTGTKHLQEQLFHRDIPQVIDILAMSVKVALLKGRSNYLCLYRLQQTQTSARGLQRQYAAEIEAIATWLPKSRQGDVGELSEVAEDSSLWPHVTSTVDNCLGAECSFYEDCYVNKARKQAMASDVVVINHHLFFADKALKEDGFGSLLPEVELVVFDEAHQLPDIASNFLGSSFSSWQIMELVRDTRAAELREKSLIRQLNSSADELDILAKDYRLSFGLEERRVAWNELVQELPALPKKMSTLADKLSEFAQVLEQAAAVGEALARCHERALELSQECQRLTGDYDNAESVRWVEVAKRTFRINQTPLDIGDALSGYFANQQQARIFTSATLSVQGDFGHYQQLIGLDESAPTKSWDSPFDYYNQAVLYVPEGLPTPKEAEFNQAVFDSALPIIQASNGAAFVLFTSFRNMQQFADRLAEADAGFVVLMQGESSKRDLLQVFVNTPNAILLGTMSFWEGVDVAGDALRCVIIDKLPFESPFEPVLKARLNAMQQAGQNPFMDYQVPRAVITLRQGAGRLIRSVEDKGVLMICDARLRTTHYGKLFLNSLPRMRRTTDSQSICGFLRSITHD